MNIWVTILIILGILLLYTIVVLMIFRDKVKKNAKGKKKVEVEKELEDITKTLWKVPLALSYLFESIIYFFYGIAYRFYKFIQDIFKIDKYENNKTNKIIRSAVATVLNSHSNLLNTYLNRRVAKVLTFLLQCISFITTYSGFTFFLGTINPIAPLFMAITIQGGCYYLLNYTSSRKRSGGGKRTLLLFILILISTLTSYIGIFDGVVKPVERMEKQYNAYCEAVKTIVDSQINISSSLKVDKKTIDDVFTLLNNTTSDSNSVITALQTRIDSTQTTQTIPISWYDKNGNIVYGFEDIVNSNAANDKADLNAIKSLLVSNKNKVEAYIKSNNVDSVLAAYENILADSNKLNDLTDADVLIYNDFYQALLTCKSLLAQLAQYSEVYSTQIADDYISRIDINTLIIDQNERDSLNSLLLGDYQTEILDPISNELNYEQNDSTESFSKKNFEDVLSMCYDFIEYINSIVVSKNVVKAEEIRNLINEVIDDNYNKLNGKIDEEMKENLKKAKNASIVENTQLMPFTSPFKDYSVIGEAVFSFVIALLVDVLSVLISWAFVKKKKSILYFKNVNDLRTNREEMLEECLMYICLASLENDEKFKGSSNKKQIQKYVVDKINEIMKTFYNHIKPLYLSDELNSFGYIDQAELKKFDEYDMKLFFTLNNVALIHPCSSFEIIKIINDDFAEFSDTLPNKENKEVKIIDNYKKIFNEDQVYYLVSKNFHVWFCENFSELLQNPYLFEFKDLK